MTSTARPRVRPSGANSGRAGDLSPVQLIRDIYAAKREANLPVISIEFFPPKTPDGERRLLDKTVPALLEVKPDFCSVTYGAGGSTRDKTLMIADRIQRLYGLTMMAHLTCVNATRQHVGAFLAEAKALGIRNILALRGDPPAGMSEPAKPQNGFEYSYELIDFIRQVGELCIGTAGFPESHMGCEHGKHVDWDRLKTKIDHGADFVLTQLFFDNADFFEFRDYVIKTLGVTVPICPGVLPILSTEQITRFTELCGARLPKPLVSRLEGLGDDTEAVTKFGIEYATKQCEELLRGGVPGLHMYSLNKARSTTEIVKNLGLA